MKVRTILIVGLFFAILALSGNVDITRASSLDECQGDLHFIDQQTEDNPFLEVTGGAAEDYAFSAQQTTDGGYIVAGYTTSFGSGGTDVLLLKYDNSGILLWARNAGGSENDPARSVKQTTDGGYIVAGSTYTYGMAYTDLFLLKYDSEGYLSWARTAGGNGFDEVFSVQETADGGYIVAGLTTSYAAGEDDAFLLKYDHSGNLSWARTAGGTASDMDFAVQQTTDGGYIVAGSTYSYGAGSADVFLLKYNSGGAIQWAKTTGGSGIDRSFSVQQTTDNGYIVAGTTTSYGAGDYDVFLLKYDSEGILEWARTAGGGDRDQALSVWETIDGGYIVGGYTFSYGAGSADVLLLKYDGGGSLEWAKIAGGKLNDQASFVQQTTDGGYSVTGHSISFGSGNFDVLLVKTDANGHVFGCDALVSSVLPEVSSPWPATDSPTVSIASPLVSTSSPTVPTAAPSPVTDFPCFEIFSDGFESGDTSAWSSTAGETSDQFTQ